MNPLACILALASALTFGGKALGQKVCLDLSAGRLCLKVQPARDADQAPPCPTAKVQWLPELRLRVEFGI